MATFIWCELVCGNCARTSSGRYVSGPTVPRRELKQWARKDGWKFSGDEAFCCRACADANREQQEQST